MELCQVLQDSELTSANGSIQRVSDLGDRLHTRLATENHARLGRMLKMEERPHAILKFRTAEQWDNRNGSLMALQGFVATHPT